MSAWTNARASEWAVRRVARLSRRYSVEITVGPAGMVCEWSPTPPRRLTKKEQSRYRAARAECITELTERLGRPVLVVEV